MALTFTVMSDVNHVAMVAADHGHTCDIDETNDAQVCIVSMPDDARAAQLVRTLTHYGVRVDAGRPRATISDPTYVRAAARVAR